MEIDPIIRLTNKISELKKARDGLEKSLKEDKESIVKMRERLELVKEEMKKKKESAGNSVTKISHIEKIVNSVEESLKKMVNASVAMEKVLEDEIIHA